MENSIILNFRNELIKEKNLFILAMWKLTLWYTLTLQLGLQDFYV
jgi:hypothetical protein